MNSDFLMPRPEQHTADGKRRYVKNKIYENAMDALFKKYLNDGILSIDDVLNSSKEDLMKTILSSVHPYKIKKSTDGRYCTYVSDETRPGGRRQIKKKSKADLFNFLIAFYGLTEIASKNKTYSILFSEWVEYKKRFIGAPNSKKSLSASTIRRYERDFDAYIKDSKFAETKLEAITAIKVEDFLIEAIEKYELNDRCASNIFGYLNQSFDFAVRSNFMAANPMVSVDKQLLLSRCKPPEITTNTERVLTKTQMADLKREILRHEEEYPDYIPDYALELAMLTGMRLGELAALKWSCIDDLYIHIDFSEHRLDYSDRESDVVIGEPKNRKHRLIPLTKDIRNLLERIKEATPYDTNGFVFTDKNNNRCTSRAIGCAIIRRGQAVGIDHVSIHRIRRTVSSLLNQVLPQRDVAELLGHTERVNEMHYHYSTADIREKIIALNSLTQSSGGNNVEKYG